MSGAPDQRPTATDRAPAPADPAPAPADPRPACLITGEVSPYRREPFRLLTEAEDVEVIAFRDAGEPVPGVVVRRVAEREAARLAGSGSYRAVICGLGGRVALPGSFAAARRAGVPFVLWASIWSHPRTPAHALSYIPTRALYARADAVVTYGPHVTEYVERHRSRGDVFEAPQAVDPAELGDVSFKDAADARERLGGGELTVVFVGRLESEKGVETLLEAWRAAALGDDARLAFAGDGPLRDTVEHAGPDVRALGPVPRAELGALYAAADAVVLPSVRTATFLEPWGLVVNEAMHFGTPVIASDAVGAVAGGLVSDGRTGLVAPADDATALAERLRALAADPDLRTRLGEAGREAVAAYTPAAWAAGMARALRAVGAGRGEGAC